MKRTFITILTTIVCLGLGMSASYFFQSESIDSWYPALAKSSLTPPKIVFPIVWTVIYIAMGISVSAVLCKPASKERSTTIILFTIQLLLNFVWSYSFFHLQSPLLGFINILTLDITVLCYTLRSRNVATIASILFIPYILWLILATYLNGYILIYN